MATIRQKAWHYIYEKAMEEQDFRGSIAVEDGQASYSYEALFENCRKYAAVFSALGMTEQTKARVGLIGTGAAETIFAFYGLNMTGAEISLISSLSVLKTERILQVAREEHLTDLILTDEFIQEETLRHIVQKKEELGLRSILLLHLPMCGCTVPPPMAISFEQRAALLRGMWGPLYMDYLLQVYGNHPVSYAANESRDTAVIIHTSGTTGGSGSPIVMSDKALNSMCNSILEMEGYEDLKKQPTTGLLVDLSNAYGIIVQVHFPLALGGKVVIIPGNALNPLYYRAIPYHKINVLFCIGMVIDLWLKYPEMAGFNFSGVKLIILGGASVSAADKLRYKEFFAKHGCKDAPIINGYGISELGGVCALSGEDLQDESIGHLLQGIDARFFDEDTHEYKTLKDAPCTGVLYLNSESMSMGWLDGKQIVKTEDIDGKPFICTNDLIQVDESGKLTYLGRANRYFLHNNGIKYQSGRVETEIARQSGIENCGIVPVFDKPIHDNIPMLCVTTTAKGKDEVQTVRQALLKVFKTERLLSEDQLPLQVLIAQELPRNNNGKIDLFKINRGEVSGQRYSVNATKRAGKITGIGLKPMEKDDCNIVQETYRGIAKDMLEESMRINKFNEPKEREKEAMPQNNIKLNLKKEIVRTVLERTQNLDLEKIGAPSAEDAVVYDNVEEILNIPYMNRDEVPLGMDIFKPVVPAGTELPVVVTIHGGGLTLGDRKISRPFGRILANKGYLVFSIEYRLAPRANVCMQLDDVCAGLDLVGQKLVDYDVDFHRIFLASESAGAYLTLYVTAMKNSKKLQEAIGYEPTHVSFKAIGLMSGMLYTNRGFSKLFLADQIYGDKITNEDFLQYMNPEHPEIINNIPPAFLISSKGDVLSSNTIWMHEALKKAGKPCQLLYYGDETLEHAFSTVQTEHPKALESIDKMLAWFEEQAKLAADQDKNAKALASKKKKLAEAMKDGSFCQQKVWQAVKECAAVDPERMHLPAILDCSRTYTYEQMFAMWEKYARVFTGLGITGTNKSRVALVGTISAEPLFAYYGLNMVGACASMFSYPDLMPGGRWKTMVEKEHITDMIVSDIMVTPQMWDELQKAKKEFGLKNIILLHTRMGGPAIGYAEMFYNEFNYTALKRIPEVQFMDQLLEKYKDTPIKYAKKTGDQLAVITHTSGTANGTRKPLPFDDSKVISSSCGAKGYSPDGKPLATRQIEMPPFDFSSSLNINGFVNYSFTMGYTLALTFFGFMHPKFVRAFKYYNVDFSFASGFMIDRWMQMEDLDKDAFASVKVLGIGGSYVPPAKIKKYEQFLRDHGFKGIMPQGYGMSELAACSLIVPKDCDEDILGYPGNVEDFLILDENDGKFYRTDEGERTGILYGRSDTMSLNTLDGETLFELTEINGKDFLCTNDSVRVNKDGSLSYGGRSNKFFANSQGVKFMVGEVETQMNAQPAISTCAAVPIFDKRIHDTVPVLYIIPANKTMNPVEAVSQAIEKVFVGNDKLKDSVLPSQFVLVEDIPCNSNGKVDVYQITRSRLQGNAYNIVPVKNGSKLVGVRAEKAEQLNSYTAGTLPEGMGKDSAFGIFDIFSTRPAIFKYKDYSKKCMENLRATKEEIKSNMEMKIPLPEMKAIPNLSAFPKPLANIANLGLILLENKEMTDQDIQE